MLMLLLVVSVVLLLFNLHHQLSRTSNIHQFQHSRHIQFWQHIKTRLINFSWMILKCKLWTRQ